MRVWDIAYVAGTAIWTALPASALAMLWLLVLGVAYAARLPADSD